MRVLFAMFVVGCCPGEAPTPPSLDPTQTVAPSDPGPTTDSDTGTVSAPLLPTTGDWTWANPLPQGSPIEEMRFATDTTAYARTMGHGLLRTTDAGETWNVVYSLQEQGFGLLHGMSFIDDQQGWLVGGQGRILRTQDGGETWTDQSPDDFPYNLQAVHFTNPLHGAVVGNTGRLLTTSDGGETWTERTHPGGSTFLNAVVFVDDQHGWAAGDDGLVIETTDGGTTWSLLQTPFSDDIEQATAAGNGVALATRTEVHVYDGAGFVRAVSADGGLLDMQFETELDATLLYFHQGELRRGTLAGGQLAFEPFRLEQGPRTFALRGDRMLVGGMWGALFTSADGGETFDEKWSTILTYDIAQLLDVAMVGDRGVTVGTNGIALFTDDGGVTWVESPTGTLTDLHAVWLEDNGMAIAGGYDQDRVPGIIWSDDFGETWFAGAVPVPNAFINGVALWDDGRGLAVGWVPGEGELVLLTEDGGQTWAAVATPGETAGYIEVWAYGTDQAWLGAGFGDLVLTTDGGQTFTTIDSGSNRAFHEVHFVDETTGWAATESQDVLHTTDGGLTWTTTVVPGTAFDDLHFGSEMVGIGIAGTGAVHGTVDGGKTWTRQANQWSSWGHVRAVAMSSETDAVIVGTELKIAYTRNAGGLLQPAPNNISR